jgi:P pilus assembly chaperone PapD
MSTFYVSATTANGIPAGNDLTGNGSRERPWATIDRANAAAGNGDTVYLNDGVYSPAKTLEISNGVSWQAIRDYRATIRGAAGQSRIIGISEDQGGTVTFGRIVIDGGNSNTSLIRVNDQSAPYTLQLNGTRLLNPTSYGIQGVSTGTHAFINLRDVQFSASNALSMLNVPSLTAGSVSIQGGSVSIENIWRSGFGGIATVNANTGGLPVTVSGVTADLHATGTDPTYGTGIYYGLRLTDVKPLVERNNITQTGSSTDQVGYTMLVTYDRIQPFDISGGIIRYNTVRNEIHGDAGKLILVGSDSDPGASLRNHANNFQIYGNNGFGDGSAEAAKLHGILVGWQKGARVYDNSMDYTSLAYVLKGMSGETLAFDNTDTHTATKSLYQKGGADVQFLYNTSYQDGGYNPDAIMVGDDGVGEYNASGAVITGNTVVYRTEKDTFLTVSAGSSATISGNNYYSATGNASSAWLYNGTAYKTIDSWKAAVESNAAYDGNVTLGQGAILDAISLAGQKLQLIGMVNGVQTYAVNFITGVSSDTSFAIRNFGVSGAAAISGTVDADMSGTGSSSLSGSGLTDRTYGPLRSGQQLVFNMSYDGLHAVGGQVLHITGNYTNTKPIDIVFRSISAPRPTIAGGSTVTANDKQVVAPFATMTVADADTSSADHTVTVKAVEKNTGAFTALAGFIPNGDGSYSFTGTVAQVNTALQALRFASAADQVAVGGMVSTRFTVTYSNDSYTVSSTAPRAVITSVNDQPVLSGLVTNQSMNDRSTLAMFSSITYADPDPGQTGIIKIALDKATRGTFSNLGGFTDNGDGAYSFSGTALATQTALHGLVFTPNSGQATPGESITAKLTITYSDGLAATQTSIAYLSIQAENTAPVLAGAKSSSITDTQTIKPFATMTVSDPDKNAVETVTVKLDDPAKGSFTTLGGFISQGSGVYTYNGRPSSAQSALRKMVFDPTDGRLAKGETELAQFTVSVSDSMAAAFDNTTKVLVSGTAPASQLQFIPGAAA